MNSGVNGWINAPGDVDWYRFDAQKGETYVLEVFARRYQSDLDSILSVHDASGKELAVNDDTVLDRHDYMSLTTKDSRIVWTAPEDKTYYLRLTDVQGNGGPSFVYFLTCRVAQPDFVLWCRTRRQGQPRSRLLHDLAPPPGASPRLERPRPG